MANFFEQPKPSENKVPQDKVDKVYSRMRLKIFLGAFLGYAGYYLVRKNLSLAAPGMISEGLLTTSQIGFAMSAVSIAYAFSKFIMGSISDRSDARKFLVVGLIISSFVMIFTGIMPYSPVAQKTNMLIIFGLMLLAGWLSGMGWPPCGRLMAHWFSPNERSFKMSLWNTSHNVGNGLLGVLASAGMAILSSCAMYNEQWRGAFIFPALIAIGLAIICWFLIRDTPQSCGLPSINEYRNDYSGIKTDVKDTDKIPFKTLFVEYIFKNKLLWAVAIANIFIYTIRYGVVDWAPTYLQESNLMTANESNLAFSIFEFSGIFGTILCGIISSRFFQGRCAPANVIFMIIVLFGSLLYWQATNVAGLFVNAQIDPILYGRMVKILIYIALTMIGGFIYGPIALIGIQALNLVPKNAAGTAAGFVGLFGYLFGDALLSKIILGPLVHKMGWEISLILFPIGCVIAIVFCMLPWKAEKGMVKY